ncbi:MAG: DUF5069 domain-containing protein [Verrucomicrobiales bacterium]
MAEETAFPRSAHDRVGGLVYFARMLDKIRLHAEGKLPPEYQDNLGEGFDGRCCRFLHVDYETLRGRVLEGGADEDVLAWCFQLGRAPSEEEILIWSKFASKMGWRDEDTGATGRLENYKAQSGLAGRADIVTFFDYYDVDEKRCQ